MLHVDRKQLFGKPLEEGRRILLNASAAYFCHSIRCQPLDKPVELLYGSEIIPLSNDHLCSSFFGQAHFLDQHLSTKPLLQSKAKKHDLKPNGDTPPLLPRAKAGTAESASQAGRSTGATCLTRRAVPQTVHEHLNSCGLGAFPGPLPDILPRPVTQPAAKPCSQPEFHLRKHGAPIRDFTFPAACMNPIIGNHPIFTTSSLGRILYPIVGFACSSVSQIQGVRGFRTGPGNSMSLAEEKEGAELEVIGQKSDAVAEKKKKYGPRRSERIPRSIIGNYDEDFEDELDLAEASPWQDPLYNLRPRVDEFLMKEMGMNPHLDLDDLVAEADDEGLVSEIPDDYAGLPLVLRWETRFVLAPGPNAYHPLNRKVKLQCYLRDLGLSEAARERMVALVGKRFDARRDELTLISQRYSHREENRKDVLRILYELIDESKKADEEEEEIAAVA